MSVEKRSALMGRIRGKDTKPELAVAAMLDGSAWVWESHARDLPGRPDFVFREPRVAIFVDGDFWHGWRFPRWRHKLAPFWEAKIQANRVRDQKNFRRLRKMGWRVIRLWEHQIAANPQGVKTRIFQILPSWTSRRVEHSSSS